MKTWLALILVLNAILADAVASNAAEPSKRVELRRPGFVFLELGTPRVEEYAKYFEEVAGFKSRESQSGFATVETDEAQLMFIDPKLMPKGHPFHEQPTGSGRGYSVEIGLVVADLDRTYAAAVKHQGWRISSGIAARPWGVRDFRVLSPDGYYFRFTEPPK